MVKTTSLDKGWRGKEGGLAKAASFLSHAAELQLATLGSPTFYLVVSTVYSGLSSFKAVDPCSI